MKKVVMSLGAIQSLFLVGISSTALLTGVPSTYAQSKLSWENVDADAPAPKKEGRTSVVDGLKPRRIVPEEQRDLDQQAQRLHEEERRLLLSESAGEKTQEQPPRGAPSVVKTDAAVSETASSPQLSPSAQQRENILPGSTRPVPSSADQLQGGQSVPSSPVGGNKTQERVSPPQDSSPGLQTAGSPSLPRRDSGATGEVSESSSSSTSVSSAEVLSLKKENAALQAQLKELKKRLMMAETQVERLSNLLESDGKVVPSRVENLPSQSAGKSQPQVAQRTDPSGQVQLATVVTEQVIPRADIASENSTLPPLVRGTQVAVESRQGKWFRIITPHGVRAWVPAATLGFGIAKLPPPSQKEQLPAIGEEPSFPEPQGTQSDEEMELKALQLLKKK